MSKAFLIAFVAIAGVAAAGVDYVNQTRRAGLSLGQMSPGDYVASVSGRYLSQKAQVEATAERAALLSRPLTSHLPPAPEGWVRRDWHDGDQARLYALPRDAEPAQIDYTDAEGRTVTATIDAEVRTRIIGAQYAVYEKPGALVAIKVSREAKQGGFGGFSQDAMKMINANIKGMSDTAGFAVIQGVTIIQTKGTFGEDISANPFRIFDAQIGPEVSLQIRAAGPDADIKAVLTAIDFGLLNSLNATPAKGIGADAPAVLDSPEAIAAAAEAQRLRDQMDGTLAEIRMMEASAGLLLASGKLTQAAHDEQMADLAARREVVIARARDAEAAVLKAAEDHAAAAPQAGQTDAVVAAGEDSGYAETLGLTGRIMGMFGGSGDAAAATVALGGSSDGIVSIAPRSDGQDKGMADFILGMIKGDAVAAGVSNEVGTATETPAPQIKSLMGKGGKLGGNCTKQGAFKRCTVGN
ncbi:MAG: hypothetical protein RLZZ528_1696 [Pseudomonadota bacterium]|jgi:hypothetical protein